MFKGKKVLVAGGTGLIGIPLVEMLLEQGATVRVSSLDDPSRCPVGAEFVPTNLTVLENCKQVCQGMDYVFNLLGVKGSPMMGKMQPGTFFFNTVSLSINLLEAARSSGCGGYLFTSSIAVYSPAEIFYEDTVWKTFPSDNDKFPGWAKRTGELQVMAYQQEYQEMNLSIVRPANVYGLYDNFDLKNAMVIPSLIKRAVDGENPFTVWGDGLIERDFVHARDVAKGMILAASQPSVDGKIEAINLGSGVGTSIKDLVEVVISNLEEKPEIVWDTSKPTGDRKRILDIAKARAIGYEPTITIEQGIKEVMDWYKENQGRIAQRYDIFNR
jgi:GDP-L-fucose synthase